MTPTPDPDHQPQADHIPTCKNTGSGRDMGVLARDLDSTSRHANRTGSGAGDLEPTTTITPKAAGPHPSAGRRKEA